MHVVVLVPMRYGPAIAGPPDSLIPDPSRNREPCENTMKKKNTIVVDKNIQDHFIIFFSREKNRRILSLLCVAGWSIIAAVSIAPL